MATRTQQSRLAWAGVRDAPAIIRRYSRFSLAVAVVVGGFIWWVTDDAVAGLIGLVGLFVVASSWGGS